MVISMKKLSEYHRVGDLLTTISSARNCFNTGTLFPGEMAYISPAQKLYRHSVQDIIPAHHRSFAKEWQLKAEAAGEQTHKTLLSSETYYNQQASILPDIQVESNVAIHIQHNNKTLGCIWYCDLHNSSQTLLH